MLYLLLCGLVGVSWIVCSLSASMDVEQILAETPMRTCEKTEESSSRETSVPLRSGNSGNDPESSELFSTSRAFHFHPVDDFVAGAISRLDLVCLSPEIGPPHAC